ncbi:hypothetical protein [Halomonas cerina]|uniref:hypothetical protein n=1 Tax=Halomonas cerina TaxID=447424 RepID=UPI001608E03B|nr:hypothetical protein [Halomonas cerina]
MADNANPPSPPWEPIGDPAKNQGPAQARYELMDVRLRRWDETAQDWTDVPDLYATWAPLPRQPKQGERDTHTGKDPSLTQTKLLLWARTPFAYGRHADGAWEDAISDLFPQYPCPPELVCYDFQGLKLPDDFRTYSVIDSSFYIFERTHHQRSPWLTISVKQEAGWHSAADVPLNIGPSVAFGQDALRFQGKQLRATSPTDDPSYTHHIELWIPETLRSVGLRIGSGKYASQGTVTAHDREGRQQEASWFIPDGFDDHRQEEERRFVFTSGGEAAISLLELRFVGYLHILEVCACEMDLTLKWNGSLGQWEHDPDDANVPSVREKIQAQIRHKREQLAHWADTGKVLAPYSSYCLEVVTRVHGRGRQGFDWEHQTYQARYAEFQTAGPPGLSTPDKPASPANAAGGNPKQSTGLATLARYIHQTMPKTVPAEGEQPPLPRPVYRADPVAVDFNEDYVHLLYALARRDLRIYLFDDNNHPVRDARGRLVVAENPLGETPDLLLDRAGRRWFAQAAASACLDLDGLDIEMTKRLQTRQILKPDRVHEARLVPLLLNIGFAGGIDEWRTVDQRADGGGPEPDWRIQGHDGFQGSNATWLSGRKLSLSPADAINHVVPGRDSIEITGRDSRESFAITGVDTQNNNIILDREPQERYSRADWRIPSRHHVRQSAAVGDPAQSIAIGDALQASAGTLWLLNKNHDLEDSDPDQPAHWSDFRASFTLGTLTVASGIIGCVFRYRDDNNHYRFTLSNIDGYRRLVRFQDAAVAQVWETRDGYHAGADYEVTVEAIGPEIQVLVNDEPVVSVSDPDGPRQGTIGLYTRATDKALFKDIRVDDFREKAPVAYRFRFTTSQYTDARHQIHSYNDETWQATYPSDAINAIGALPFLGDPPDPEEHRGYQTVASAIQGALQLPGRLEVSRLDHGGTPKALLIRSPEPIDWKTTALTVSRAPKYDVSPNPPGILKLIDVGFDQDPRVIVLLRETADISGTVIEYRRSDTSGFAPSLVGGRFHHDLTREATLESLTIVDTQDTGAWQVEATGLTARDLGQRWSTVIEDDREVGEAVFSTRLRLASDSKAALVFRYGDPDNHYRLVLGTGDGRQLIRLTGRGGAQIMWRDDANLVPGQTHGLRIEVGQDTLRGYLDTVPLFTVNDPDAGKKGRIGLSAWGREVMFTSLAVHADAHHSLLAVNPFREFHPDQWQFVDEPSSGSRSDWQHDETEQLLKQTREIHGTGDGPYDQPGTYAVTGDRAWRDYRLMVHLSSGSDGAIGVMFRYQDDNNFYRFSMDSRGTYRRLIRKVDGQVRLLWQDDTGFTVGREYQLTMDCVDDGLTGYVDGERIFDLKDTRIDAGAVGLYCRANRDARFYKLWVVAPADGWVPYHTFGDENALPAGTRIDIVEATQSAGSQADPRHLRRQRRGTMPGDLPPEQVHLRVRMASGEPQHMRQFRQPSEYLSVNQNFAVLRSRDGTGVMLVPQNGFKEAQYRITFMFDDQEDDSQQEEPVHIDIPW